MAFFIFEMAAVQMKVFGDFTPNRSQNMVIFRFSKMASAAILDFQNFKFSTTDGFKRVELRRRAKLGRNRLNRCRDMAIFLFLKI